MCILTISITIFSFKQANSLFQALCIILNSKHVELSDPIFYIFYFMAEKPSLAKNSRAELRSEQRAGVWMALTLTTRALKAALANKRIKAEH